MICLTHIPKTGGTTFRNILINNFSWRHVDFPNFPKKNIQQIDFPLNSKILEQIRSLSGHRLRYSDEIRLSFPDFKFVVFLRDPISRIISLFFHIQRFENPNLQFRKWVYENYDTPLLSNSQTLFVAGEPDLSLAKAKIDNEYFFAGCLEQFDLSLLLFQKMHGSDFDIRYVRKNVAKRTKDEIINDSGNRDALDKLYQFNEIDIQLYDYVNEAVLLRYQQKYGKVTANDITGFKKSYEQYRPHLFNKNIFRIAKYIFYENMFRINS